MQIVIEISSCIAKFEVDTVGGVIMTLILDGVTPEEVSKLYSLLTTINGVTMTSLFIQCRKCKQNVHTDQLNLLNNTYIVTLSMCIINRFS